MLAVASSDGYCSFLVFEQGLPQKIIQKEDNYYEQSGIEEKVFKVE